MLVSAFCWEREELNIDEEDREGQKFWKILSIDVGFRWE